MRTTICGNAQAFGKKMIPFWIVKESCIMYYCRLVKR